jgi:riboflavin kinase/FMN adenylyltransferase
MELGNYLRPKYGIYAVRVTLDDGSEHAGVASLGVRPTFDPPKELLEAVLFDFEGDLYGQTIEVALHAYLRPEMKFDGLEALKAQMGRDAAEARKLLLPSA